MPTDWAKRSNLGPLIGAWTKHYFAKGCSQWKAECLAYKKAVKGKYPSGTA